MVLVRRMVLHCLTYNIAFQAEHIPGKINTLADSLSCLQVARFTRLAVNMEAKPTAYPPLPEYLS